MSLPEGLAGLRHVALSVEPLEACVDFYSRLLGMKIEWQPDADNVYLTSGCDNLALHRTNQFQAESNPGALDHIGFILKKPEQVDAWYEYLKKQGVKMRNAPRTHRDGARSFYCYDPARTVVQFIHHPPVSGVI